MTKLIRSFLALFTPPLAPVLPDDETRSSEIRYLASAIDHLADAIRYAADKK